MEKILSIIEKKISEHQTEINGAQNELLDKNSQLKNKSVSEAAKLLVLKDKIMFHKAALLVLEDLKKDINNG